MPATIDYQDQYILSWSFYFTFLNFYYFSVLFNTFRISPVVHCHWLTHLLSHHQNCPGPTQTSQIVLEAPVNLRKSRQIYY